jgi:folate-binding protein YgfZ
VEALPEDETGHPTELEIADQVEALSAGTAYAELGDHTVTLASGEEARGWLNDLVTTDVAGLERGASRPSLLLTPTGRIRAAFHVLCLGDRDFALVQRSDQLQAISTLLEPYVLSSDVTLSPSRLRVFAVPGGDDVPAVFGNGSRPSVLAGGFDLLFGLGGDDVAADARAALTGAGFLRADLGGVERLRIHRGQPRFGIDLDTASLPAEAGLDGPPVTDRTKGCFLGQEAVAKIANLGHPRVRILAFLADAPVAVGEDVLTGDAEAVGSVTSADGGMGLLRLRWDAADDGLRSGSGAALRARPSEPEPV